MKTTDILKAMPVFLLAFAAGAQAPASHPFGKTPDGRTVTLFSLSNTSGMTMEICDYGCAIVRLTAPDRGGKFADVVLGFNTLDEYIAKSPCFGAVVGRYANRIANGKFTLDGREYSLDSNSSHAGIPCSIHGGKVPFHKVLWKSEMFSGEGTRGVKMHYLSRDGEAGFPGNLDVSATFSLTDRNEVRIDYSATTDKATPVNLSHHGYFNLKGEGRGDVLGHVLTLHAAQFTPDNQGMIPTGEIRPVKNTPFDFVEPKPIGAHIADADEQIALAGGYDHNFVLNSQDGSLAIAAEVYEPESGRILEVLTTEPGVQFFTANFMNGKLVGKSGPPYVKHAGFCLETQHYPDSPNHENFPSTILRPGTTFSSTTVFRFSIRR